MKYTEQQISKMAAPISKTEDEKCKNAIRMVRDAMKRLNYTDDGKEIRTYAEDSYAYALDLRQMYSDKKITVICKTNAPSKQIGRGPGGPLLLLCLLIAEPRPAWWSSACTAVCSSGSCW